MRATHRAPPSHHVACDNKVCEQIHVKENPTRECHSALPYKSNTCTPAIHKKIFALTSSALGSLEPPGLGGVPVDAVVRQPRGDEGPEDGAPPVVAQHLQQVLPPTEVVRRPLRVVLVRRLAVQHCG